MKRSETRTQERGRGFARAALLLASAALAAGSLGVAGCGDDEDSGGEVTIPEISTPSETAATEGTTTAPGGVTTAPDTGGTGTETEGGTTTGGATTGEDTATSDTPPRPGSPEEAFEKQCEKDPAACG